jgi:hypothetical protein
MASTRFAAKHWLQPWTLVLLAFAGLAAVNAARATCRVSDFTTTPLSSLKEIERLSFVRQMTQTEYDKLKHANKGDPSYYSFIADSATRAQAKLAAQKALDGLHMQNTDDYASIWASDFLTDEQQRDFITCSSHRRPGIVFAGRLAKPDTFNLSFAHLTPVGIEKIRLQVIASRNISNIGQFEAFLTGLGEKDNYTAETFPLMLANPGERAVLVLRAGWETPLFIYIPAYPLPEIH